MARIGRAQAQFLAYIDFIVSEYDVISRRGEVLGEVWWARIGDHLPNIDRRIIQKLLDNELIETRPLANTNHMIGWRRTAAGDEALADFGGGSRASDCRQAPARTCPV